LRGVSKGGLKVLVADPSRRGQEAAPQDEGSIGDPVMKNSVKLPIVATAMVCSSLITLSYAQQPPKPKAPPKSAQTTPNNPPAPAADSGAAAANTPPPPGWTARCGSASRDAPLECAIEQSAVLPRTGQLVILVNIRVPADTHTPSALVQLPLGLNLPGGAKARGCYAGTTIRTRPAGGDEIRQAVKGIVPEFE
jgi:invasion protein IalB